MSASAGLVTVFLVAVSAARTFTVYNNCPFTIWPAVYTDPAAGSAVPNVATGWEADAFTFSAFQVPDNWKAGRIWGRRDCVFNATVSSCLSGDCPGGLLCTLPGKPPASLAEWTLSGANGNDFFDVSLVDGANLPMSIATNQACPVAGCYVDLGPGCPDALKGPLDATGFPLGCKSACVANLDNTPSNSPNCCSGSFNTPSSCPSSGVQFYQYFKGACPDSYAYAFDESSSTALFTCPSSLQADYTLTFCPSNATMSTTTTTTGTMTGTSTTTGSGTDTGTSTASAPAESQTFVNPGGDINLAGRRAQIPSLASILMMLGLIFR